MKTGTQNGQPFTGAAGSATFAGKHAEQYEALKHAVLHAARDSGRGDHYDYLETVPINSLSVEVVNALHDLGYSISKSLP